MRLPQTGDWRQPGGLGMSMRGGEAGRGSTVTTPPWATAVNPVGSGNDPWRKPCRLTPLRRTTLRRNALAIGHRCTHHTQ